MYIVINGGGKVGEYLATEMLRNGNQVAIIEKDPATAEYLSSELSGQILIINGDGCMSRYQEDADIRRADVFASTTGHDDANLVSCEIATRVFNVPRCIARVNSPKNLAIFREVGIEPISSTTIIAKIIEEDTMFDGISVLSNLASGNVELSEVTIPRFRHHIAEEGVEVGAIGLPDGCLVVAVSRDDAEMEVVNGATLLFPGDTVVLASDKDKTAAGRAALKQL